MQLESKTQNDPWNHQGSYLEYHCRPIFVTQRKKGVDDWMRKEYNLKTIIIRLRPIRMV